MRWRTVKRSLAVLVIVTSLALVAGPIALWIRTYSASDTIYFSSPHGMSVAYTCQGGVGLLTQPLVTPPGWEWDRLEFGNPPEPFQAGFGAGEETWFGIRRGSYFTSMAHNAWAVAVPLWLFVAASLLPAAGVVLYALAKRIIRARRGRGFQIVVGPATDRHYVRRI